MALRNQGRISVIDVPLDGASPTVLLSASRSQFPLLTTIGFTRNPYARQAAESIAGVTEQYLSAQPGEPSQIAARHILETLDQSLRHQGNARVLANFREFLSHFTDHSAKSILLEKIAGTLYGVEERLGPASIFYNLARSLSPHRHTHLQGLALVNNLAGDTTLAARRADELVPLSPDSHQLIDGALIAIFHDNEGTLNEAIPSLQRLVSLTAHSEDGFGLADQRKPRQQLYLSLSYAHLLLGEAYSALDVLHNMERAVGKPRSTYLQRIHEIYLRISSRVVAELFSELQSILARGSRNLKTSLADYVPQAIDDLGRNRMVKGTLDYLRETSAIPGIRHVYSESDPTVPSNFVPYSISGFDDLIAKDVPRYTCQVVSIIQLPERARQHVQERTKVENRFGRILRKLWKYLFHLPTPRAAMP